MNEKSNTAMTTPISPILPWATSTASFSLVRAWASLSRSV